VSRGKKHQEEEVMKSLSKIMATTAAMTLAGGAAFAQTAGGATGGTVGVTGTHVEPRVTVDHAQTGVTGQAGATGTVGTTATGTVAGTTAQPGTTTQPGVTAGTAATTETGTAARTDVFPQLEYETFTRWNERLERGERVDVVTTDGVALGHVAQPGTFDERGASQFSITLDPELALGTERVTYIGMADVDADGRIVLPMAQQDIMASIQAQIADPG
jgi:hypothetical protein